MTKKRVCPTAHHGRECRADRSFHGPDDNLGHGVGHLPFLCQNGCLTRAKPNVHLLLLIILP